MNNDKAPKPWKVLHSQYLLQRPWCTVRRDCVQLPSGVENDEYYVLEYPDFVNVIAITTDGRYLLIRQYRHGLGRTGVELVAGTVDPDDPSLEAAARRELLEETGFGGGRWRHFATFSPNASAVNNLSHTFVAEGVECQGSQQLEPTEDIEVLLLSEDEVRRLLEADAFVQALMAAPLWKYLARKS